MKELLLILLITFSIGLLASGPPNPNCMPFSECWCQSKPNHPKCKKVAVPINGGISFLAIGGLLLGIYYYKNKKL